MNNPVLRRIWPATIALVLAAVGGTLLVQRAAQAQPAYELSVSSTTYTGPGNGDPVSVQAFLASTPAQDVIIGAEFSGSSSDPEQADVDNGSASYGTPDYFCVIQAGGTECVIEIPMYTSPISPERLRFYVASGDAFVDDQESAPSPVPLYTSILSNPGCTYEPDATAVATLVSTRLQSGDRPAPTTPPAGADPNPDTCDTGTPTSSPSPTTTSSTTPTPTISPTPTESPTPTTSPTPTSSPSPTASPTSPPVVVANAPYGGRYRMNECEAFPELGATDGCTAGANAEPANGAVTAFAEINSADGGPLTVTRSATASGGITQSVDGAGRQRAVTYIFRFWLDYAGTRTTTGGPSFGPPSGYANLGASAMHECGSNSDAETVTLSGDSDVEGRLVELRFTIEPSCALDGPVTLHAGLDASATITALDKGSVRVEARATLLEILAQY